MNDIQDYLTPINTLLLNDDEAYAQPQIGALIAKFETHFPDVSEADIVLVGVNEYRGRLKNPTQNSADAVRRQLYALYLWHDNVRIADIGNLKVGEKLADSYSALKIVLKELIDAGKKVVIVGGSHDNTLAQYEAYAHAKQLIDVAVIDAKIDLNQPPAYAADTFLLPMLTNEPNYVRHYNHIGFQSYYVHPHILETIDKLRFDCYRVGAAREQMDEMEPVLRSSHMVSFDISAIKYSDAPSSICSPNGFTGEEACTLMRYAGMSGHLSSIGLYEFETALDQDDMTARQLAQMLWYFIDGVSRGKYEPDLEERHQFNQFHTVFNEVDTVFLQSKRTGRWWMQLPDSRMIACSYNDYLFATKNEMPERWLRAQEREV